MPIKPAFTNFADLPTFGGNLSSANVTNAFNKTQNFINALDLNIQPKEVESVHFSPIAFSQTSTVATTTITSTPLIYLSTNVTVPFDNAKCVVFSSISAQSSNNNDSFLSLWYEVNGDQNTLRIGGISPSLSGSLFNMRGTRGTTTIIGVANDLGLAGVKTIRIRMDHSGTGSGTLYANRGNLWGLIYN